MNYTELNIAKERIPQYKGKSKNLSYYIRQSEKFINLFQNQEQSQENFTFNRLLYEICCSKLTGTARDVFIISNCKPGLKNENLLENDLITCFQLKNESYQDYYERIRTKLQCLLEQININKDNEPLKIYNKKALATYLSRLVVPYYLLMNYHTVNSLEECLLKLKDYDNHRQQANVMNFMRQKSQNKQNYKRINNYQKPQQFKSHKNNSPNFNPQIASRQFNYNLQIPTNNQYKQNLFPRGPINIQNRPITTRYPTNNEVFGKKIKSRPTPMSISTRNTNANYRPNFPKQQNVFQSNGPRNFKSKELFNINEGHNDSEPIEDDFEDRLVDYNEGLIEADENDEKPLGAARVINHFHNIIFHLNITHIEVSYRQLITNLIILEHKTTEDPLSKRLYSQLKAICIEIENICNKFNHRKNKRALINVLGKIVKFITRNLNEDDLSSINGNLDKLYANQKATIEKVNVITSFANHLTQRYFKDLKDINQNIKETRNLFNVTLNTLDYRIILQSEIYQGNLLLEQVRLIERTISLAFKDIINLEIINFKELLIIERHLKEHYSIQQLLPLD
ncbi:hypothetical protein FQA39_LY00719 [Lamprigera yunnana]|nr:hypothetical protein FQA39_LY00719 [Lamprigera yunnana]